MAFKNLAFHCLLLQIVFIGFQGALSDEGNRVRRTLFQLLKRPREKYISGGGIEFGFQKKVTLPTIGHIEGEKPTIIEQQRPIIIHNESPGYTTNTFQKETIESSGTFNAPTPSLTTNNYQSGSIEAQGTFTVPSPTIVNQGFSANYEDQGFIQQTGTNQIKTGNIQVYNQESQQVVEEVKQTLVEEKVPTIIKTQTPTYVQQTMEQQVVRETVPHTIHQQETHMVTETKPIYVTQTRPVTVMKDKTIYETRDRIVNVPGQQMITKGPTTVTRERGRGTIKVYPQGNNYIGFRLLDSTKKSKKRKHKKSKKWNRKHLHHNMRLWGQSK